MTSAGTTYAVNILYTTFEKCTLEGGYMGTPYPKEEHVHSHVYHIVCYVSGESLFSVNGHRHPSKRGVLSLVSPGERHVFTPLEKGEISLVEVAFSLQDSQGNVFAIPFHKLLSLYSGADISPIYGHIVLDEPATASLERKIGEMTDQLKLSGPFSQFIGIMSLIEIFTLIVKHVTPVTLNLCDKHKNEPLEKVKEVIEQHFSEHFSLGYLAKLVGLSKEHLCRRFSACYHISPLAYQQQLRIMAAQNLLRNTVLSCKEISSAVGFQDSHFFSKIFSRLVGVSPVEYRNGSFGTK